MAFYQQRKYTWVMFMSIVLSSQLWAVQYLLLFTLSSSPFLILYTSLIFLCPKKTSYKKEIPCFNLHSLNKIFLQSNLAQQNMKCDWSMSFIQVGRKKTYPIFQNFYHTNICTSSLYEFAVSKSQTSWIKRIVSYKLNQTNCIIQIA